MACTLPYKIDAHNRFNNGANYQVHVQSHVKTASLAPALKPCSASFALTRQLFQVPTQSSLNAGVIVIVKCSNKLRNKPVITAVSMHGQHSSSTATYRLQVCKTCEPIYSAKNTFHPCVKA